MLSGAHILEIPENARDAHVYRHAVGARDVARNLNPKTHTRRLATFAAALVTIAAVHGACALPDTNARGQGRNEQYCYSVRFEAAELRGPQGRFGDCLYIDLFDDYLDPA